jgi:anaerobic ribonucleoside-triphosphate reductase
LPLQVGNFLSVGTEQLDAQQNLKALNSGANLIIIDLHGSESKPEDLMKLTLSLMENHKAEFFTYNRAATYCSNCQKSWFGSIHKCPSCGSMGTLLEFDRFSST